MPQPPSGDSVNNTHVRGPLETVAAELMRLLPPEATAAKEGS